MPTAWDPSQYDRFARERRQPFRDLVALVRPKVASVVDLGCGTGETTAELHAAVGAERTLGVDRSETMLERSTAFAKGGVSFERASIESFSPQAPVDLVFSNAALHWVPDHPALFRRLFSFLRPGGQLAVQLPAMAGSASHDSATEVAAEKPFATALSGVASFQTALSPEEYASLLHDLGAEEQIVRLQIYAHQLASKGEVVEWVKGALLTSYEERLTPGLFALFLARYRERLLERLPDRRPFLFLYRRILLWARRREPAGVERRVDSC